MIQSTSFEFRRGFPLKWIQENISTRIPFVPVDPIQISKITCFQKPCNLAFPCCDWFSTDTSQTWHWIREDGDFAVANWTVLSINTVVSPHWLPPINRCNSSNFSLVRSHLKQLSQRFIGKYSVLSISRWTAAWRVKTEIYSIWLCSHRDALFHPSNRDHIFVSESRRPSPCAARCLLIHGDCVAKCCHCLRFLNFLKRRVSSYPHPELHLFGILDAASRLYYYACSFHVLDQSSRKGALSWVSLGFSTQSDCSGSQKQRMWKIINTLLRWWGNDWNCFSQLFLSISSVSTEQSQICVLNT